MEEEEGGSGEGGVGTDGRDGGWCRGGDPGRAAGSGALVFFFFFFRALLSKVHTRLLC